MLFALCSATLEENYTCSTVVHVWYGINILCIRHFTPPVDLSDRPFKTERDWLSRSARQQRQTTLLIYLKSTGRYERPIAYMFSFCWHFLCHIQWLKYLVSFCDFTVELWVSSRIEISSVASKLLLYQVTFYCSKTNRYFHHHWRERKLLLSLCFCVEMWRTYLPRR